MPDMESAPSAPVRIAGVDEKSLAERQERVVNERREVLFAVEDLTSTA